jgi:disulfide oxidoreductase YuzD
LAAAVWGAEVVAAVVVAAPEAAVVVEAREWLAAEVRALRSEARRQCRVRLNP